MSEAAFQEQDLEFASGGLSLAGTLTKPTSGAKLPAILFLPGSGKTDRNDNAKQLSINLFPQLVPTLSELGLITFRYDKRGVGASEGSYFATGFDDLFNDAEAAISYLADREDVDSSRIFVLGHSEGAILAVRLAAAETGIAGAIALAGSAKSGQETMLWQTRQIAKSISGFSALVIRLLRIDLVSSLEKNLKRIKQTTKNQVRIQGNKINAKWMREFLEYDPSPDLRTVRAPLLGITGSNDIQVDPGDLKLMAEQVPAQFESYELPGLSHLFRQDHEGLGLKGYRKQASMPLDGSVIKLVGGWLAHRLDSSKK